MATSNTHDNNKKDPAKDALNKVRARMQGYKQPVPEVPIIPDSPAERPLNDKQSDTEYIADPVSETTTVELPTQEESSPYSTISGSLLKRLSSVSGVETDRYRSRPWRQLPDETAIEYAIFGEYLKPPLARGHDLEALAGQLNAPELSGWYSQLLNTLQVPKYVVDGFDVKKKHTVKQDKTKSAELVGDHEAETRVLWWLSERNCWPERGRLYDAWQMDVLAGKRKLQIQQFANEIHTHYVDHAYEMLSILTESRQGLARGVKAAQGQFRKLVEIQRMPPADESQPYIERTIEWDPIAQLEAMHKITDRLFGPLPNMLDGSVSTVLDQSLSVPAAVKPDGEIVDGDLTGTVSEKKRSNAPWMLERVAKVQADLDRRKLIESPVRPDGPGENEKPSGA